MNFSKLSINLRKGRKNKTFFIQKNIMIYEDDILDPFANEEDTPKEEDDVEEESEG